MLFMVAEVIQDGIKLSGAEVYFRNCIQVMKRLHTFTNSKKRHFKMHNTKKCKKIYHKNSSQ